MSIVGKTLRTTPKKGQTKELVEYLWVSHNEFEFLFFSWDTAFQICYTDLAWWKSFYMDLHEKKTFRVLTLKLCWLNSALWLVTETHSSLRTIMLRILLVTENHSCNVWKKKEGKTMHHWVFPYKFYRKQSIKRFKHSASFHYLTIFALP